MTLDHGLAIGSLLALAGWIAWVRSTRWDCISMPVCVIGLVTFTLCLACIFATAIST